MEAKVISVGEVEADGMQSVQLSVRASGGSWRPRTVWVDTYEHPDLAGLQPRQSLEVAFTRSPAHPGKELIIT
jgi:hypothetical protein